MSKEVIVEFLVWTQKSFPLESFLIALMLLDIGFGICVAKANNQLSSSVSLRGMWRKAGILLGVAFGKLMDTASGQYATTPVICSLFSFTQVISILENWKALDLPMPKQLADMLAKKPATEPTTVIQHISNATITSPVSTDGSPSSLNIQSKNTTVNQSTTVDSSGIH